MRRSKKKISLHDVYRWNTKCGKYPNTQPKGKIRNKFEKKQIQNSKQATGRSSGPAEKKTSAFGIDLIIERDEFMKIFTTNLRKGSIRFGHLNFLR
jgi:hypothetical protein